MNIAPVTALLHRLAVGAADMLLPGMCVSCQRPANVADSLVCSLCWARITPLPSPRCARCDHPVRGYECAWCELLPPYVRAVRSVCWATGRALAIVHALKYDGWERVAMGMAIRMSRLAWPDDVVRERAAVVAVPLSSTRKRERGFNQSERIASALAVHWSVPVWNDVLMRGRHTATQTRLTPGERRRNVSGAFCTPPGVRERLRGAHVVIVDDVVTTAATLNACAAALHDGGARIISYVTFGRAPALGDRIEPRGET
jgi:ComF family protein